MNIEAYSFAVVTAVVGMGVVFFFLVFLSVMMYVIRYFFDSPGPKSDDAGRGQGEQSQGGASPGGADLLDGHGIPRWVVAGALAYLLVEEQEYTPHSLVWTQRGQR